MFKIEYTFAEQGSKEMITSNRESLEGAIRDNYQKKSSAGGIRGSSFGHLFFLDRCSHKWNQMEFHSFFQLDISFAMKIKRIVLEFRSGSVKLLEYCITTYIPTKSHLIRLTKITLFL